MMYFFICMLHLSARAKPESSVKNDSITLAQAYMNLSLTKMYFDSLEIKRISKIIPFEEGELASIKDSTFIRNNKTLYHFTHALLYYNKTKYILKRRGLGRSERSGRGLERRLLLALKETLELAIENFNNAAISNYYKIERENNSFYETINFDNVACDDLESEILTLKSKFTPYFNNDIEPDFERIFYTAKTTQKYDFETMSRLAAMYNLPINLSLVNGKPTYFNHGGNGDVVFISKSYNLDLKLDLISKYLQLKYFTTSNDQRVIERANPFVLYKTFNEFENSSRSSSALKGDKFFQTELNQRVRDVLHKELQRKYPYQYEHMESAMSVQSSEPFNPAQTKYFFPNPAPKPSASIEQSNYKPELKSLQHTDTYLCSILHKKGYKNHLRYFYGMDGFALATGLEKFDVNGGEVSEENRWIKNLGEGKFSYFEIFKSLFFETESEFRMFVFIVASKAADVSDDALSASTAEALMKHSYNTLPDSLKGIVLENKTLSVLIYHFHQDDIGEVPMLTLNRKITAENYLKKAGLSEVIKP